MWALAILIIPAFVLWGSGSSRDSRRMPKYAGEIFGKEVSFREFEAQFLASRNDAFLRYGQNLNQIAQYLDFDSQTWERLILLYEADKQNIKVSDQEVVSVIRTIGLFQRDGRFHQATYNTVLDYAFGTSPREFEEQIRDTIAIAKLREKVTAEVSLSDEEIERQYKKENEKAKAEYIFVDPAEFSEQIHPAYEELQEYYQNNKDEFQKPEQASVKYVGLLIDQAKELFPAQVDEEEIIAYYQENPDEFLKEEGETTEEDEDILEEEAQTQSEEAETSEETETVEEIDAAEEIELPEEAQLEEVAELQSEAEDDPKPTDEQKEQIKEKLSAQKSLEALEDKMWGVIDQMAEAPEAFEEIAKNNGLEVKESGFFGPQDLIPGIGLSYEFLNTAFSLDLGQISDVINTAKGYFIMKIKEKKAAHVPALEEIKEEVEKAVVEQKSRELAKEKAQELSRQLNELMQDKSLDFQKAAEKLGLELKETAEFSRSSYITGLGRSPELADSIFSLKPGEVSSSLEAPSGFCILRLQEIIPVDEKVFVEEKEGFAQGILATKKNEFFGVWRENLIQKAELKDNIAKIRSGATP